MVIQAYSIHNLLGACGETKKVNSQHPDAFPLHGVLATAQQA
jgi:hypothetical protein